MILRGKQRTHCKRGHTLAPENTYVDAHGRLVCRQCQRVVCREHRRRRRGSRLRYLNAVSYVWDMAHGSDD